MVLQQMCSSLCFGHKGASMKDQTYNRNDSDTRVGASEEDNSLEQQPEASTEQAMQEISMPHAESSAHITSTSLLHKSVFKNLAEQTKEKTHHKNYKHQQCKR